MEGARNYRAVIQYDGTGYEGFQIQARRPTIQAELEAALERLTQAPVRVHGAGRTDAGVHALGQVVSFRALWRHDVQELHSGLNALLPEAIAVRELSEADEGFHARFSALSRVYRYNVYLSAVRCPLLERYSLHVTEPLDLGAMNEASAALVGVHDLAALGQSAGAGGTVRRVDRAYWEAMGGLLAGDHEAKRLYRFEIEANGFLRGMVRRAVSTLLTAGAGRMSAQAAIAILLSRDISRAAPPAPARGLCLMRVVYARGAQADLGGEMGGRAATT